jgi:hypothetical protein
MPIATDIEAAPPDIMKIIRCKCNMSGKNKPCSTMLCSCMKHGLPCVSACKHCCGELCANVCHDTVEISDCYEDDSFKEILVPDDCTQFDIPWIDEEVVESSNPHDIIPEECLMIDVPWIDEEEVCTSTMPDV